MRHRDRGCVAIIESSPWNTQQGEFEAIRTFALALLGEVGDLADATKWVPDATPIAAFHHSKKAAAVEARIAALAIDVFRLAGLLGMDLRSAIRNESGMPEYGER